jgi:hypothetical protein
MQNKSHPRVKVILSLPRCGTHFLWSRYVRSGKYQLIYDADIIPALSVLSETCSEKLKFMCPPPSNTNYNFAYNSLKDTGEPLTAKEHLQFLFQQYGVNSAQELFNKLLSLQDNNNKTLFIINRFVYTCSYDFLFNEFNWPLANALKALTLLKKWLHESGISYEFNMIIREPEDWSFSLRQLCKRRKDMVALRLKEFKDVLDYCISAHIPCYAMDDVINLTNQRNLNFSATLPPLEISVLRNFSKHATELSEQDFTSSTPLIRIKRFLEYLQEPDDFKRTSIVRSIGDYGVLSRLPILGERIRKDYEGNILNNAKLRVCEQTLD